jgi:hypothetical protein
MKMSIVLSVLAIASCMLAPSCNAHGFLKNPLSRARVYNYDEYTASAGNGLGTDYKYNDR